METHSNHVYDFYWSQFDYDEEHGILIRKRTAHKQICVDSKGYVITYVGGKSIKAHRLIWMMIHRSELHNQIDHINGIRNDNRIENFRLALPVENNRNMKISATKEKYLPKGTIVRPGRKKKYSAYIYQNNKAKFLGCYLTADESAHAYNKAAIELYGNFACLNPIGVWNEQ